MAYEVEIISPAKKLEAIFEAAPWLANDGKAVHLPIIGMPKDHQLTWPELKAILDDLKRLHKYAYRER